MRRYSRDENKHREEHIVGGMKYDTVWSIQWWKNSHVQYWNVQFSVTRVLKSLSENPESDLHFWLQVKFLNTVCHLTQYYQFEGYYNRVHLRLKMMGGGLRCKKMQFCSFDPCSSSSSSMQVSSTATAAAASDNLGKLQISTHDRRIAFFFNPPLLFSAPLRDAFLQEFGIYAKKSKDFWQPVHTFYLTSF